jgi:hypothetical protein
LFWFGLVWFGLAVVSLGHTHTHIHNEEKEEKKTELLCRHLLSVGPEQQSNTPEASKQANKQTSQTVILLVGFFRIT